jgi:hypothetical protein
MTNLRASIQISGSNTLETIAPAVFASNPADKCSSRYSFVSTKDLLSNFEKLGWGPTSARQCGGSDFGRHIIKLENPKIKDIGIKSDKIIPQIILDNSHNGTSRAQLHMGLFRLICTNGLVASIPGLASHIQMRHMGINLEELKLVSSEFIEHFNDSSKRIKKMMEIDLTQKQKELFAKSAIAWRDPIRYIKNDEIDFKKVMESVDVKEILTPLRKDDNGNNIWVTFNVIQERLMKAQFTLTSDSGKKSNPRPIVNAIRDLSVNKKMWELAESFI